MHLYYIYNYSDHYFVLTGYRRIIVNVGNNLTRPVTAMNNNNNNISLGTKSADFRLIHWGYHVIFSMLAIWRGSKVKNHWTNKTAQTSETY